MMNGRTIAFCSLVFAVGLGAGYFFGYDHGFEQAVGGTINSFEECVAAGNPVMESYPEQCRTKDGETFVRGLDDEDAVFCTQDAMECPDGSYVGREGPNCEFAPCPSGGALLCEGGVCSPAL